MNTYESVMILWVEKGKKNDEVGVDFNTSMI